MEVLSLGMRTRYGIVSNRHGSGVLAGVVPREDNNRRHPEVVSRLATLEDADEAGALGDNGGRALTFPIGPFFGLTGVAPATAQKPSPRPPGRHGGHLDIRRLMEGAPISQALNGTRNLHATIPVHSLPLASADDLPVGLALAGFAGDEVLVSLAERVKSPGLTRAAGALARPGRPRRTKGQDAP
jgi:hypothetical protein